MDQTPGFDSRQVDLGTITPERFMQPGRPVLYTYSFMLRHAVPDIDAPFILELLNTKPWLQFIGDRNVHSIDDANRYIETAMVDSYKAHRFGLWIVTMRDDYGGLGSEVPWNLMPRVGICGLLHRDYLPAPDLGYAILPKYAGKGYTTEAARGAVDYADKVLGIHQLFGVTDQGNGPSRHVLTQAGFTCGTCKTTTTPKPQTPHEGSSSSSHKTTTHRMSSPCTTEYAEDGSERIKLPNGETLMLFRWESPSTTTTTTSDVIGVLDLYS